MRHARGPRGRSRRDSLAREGRGRARPHVPRSRRADEPLRQRAAGARRATAANASTRCSDACPSCTSPCSARSKPGAVVSPLFSAFGPEPIKQRLLLGDARVLVTTAASVSPQGRVDPRRGARARARAARRERRVRRAAARRRPTSSRSVRPIPSSSRCCTSRAARRAPRRGRCTCTRRSSRTTRPRGSRSTCIPTTSSGAPPIPGWVTGTSYGIIAPLTIGATLVLDEAEFDAAAVVRDARARARHGLVHRADRDPHDDAGGGDRRARPRSLGACASSRASASR